MRCVLCKKEVDLPFCCSYCGQHFCDEHRLPEQHMCPGLPKRSWNGRKEVYDEIRYESARRQIREKESKRLTDEHKFSIRKWRPRKKRLIVKIFVVIVFLCIGFIFAWKNGLLPEDINQIFVSVFDMAFGTVEYISGLDIRDKLLDQTDFNSFYRGKSQAFFSSVKVWGWIWGVYGIPFVIPLIPQTTLYNRILSLELLVAFILLVCGVYKQKFVLVSVLLLLTVIVSLEYERYALDDFQDRDELIIFLHSDNTDTMVYTGDFVCEDFSRMLIRRAKDSGYRLYFHVMKVENPRPWEDRVVKHAVCKAYIISENKWIEVEPQTDGLEW